MKVNEPTAVVLWMRDGTEREEVFATRWQAEWFVYQLPYLMTVGQWSEVRSAILSPLVLI